jgi:hypothetical protein
VKATIVALEQLRTREEAAAVRKMEV